VGVGEDAVLAAGEFDGLADALLDGPGVGLAAGTRARRGAAKLKTLSKTGRASVKLSLIVPRAPGEMGW